MRLSALLILPLATGLMLGPLGCGDDGGGSSDEQEVKRVAQAYVDALADEDAVAACEYLPDDGGCVEATAQEISQGQALGDGFARVGRVRVSGNVARADFSEGGFVVLSRSAGGWRIGAPAAQAAELGGPKPPKTERCSPRQEKKLRQESERLGISVGDGPLYCAKASVTER